MPCRAALALSDNQIVDKEQSAITLTGTARPSARSMLGAKLNDRNVDDMSVQKCSPVLADLYSG